MKDIKEIKSEQFEIQRAIKFLIDNILDDNGNQKQLNTTKPLLIHSIKVGCILMDYNYGKDLIIAGVLHDINEDADTSFDEIEQKFGKKVADLVRAVSFNRAVPEGEKRIKDSHDRKKAAGKDAIIISIADTISNFPYLKFAESPKQYQQVKNKWLKYFDEVAVLASDEPIYKVLEEKFKTLKEEK